MREKLVCLCGVLAVAIDLAGTGALPTRDAMSASHRSADPFPVQVVGPAVHGAGRVSSPATGGDEAPAEFHVVRVREATARRLLAAPSLDTVDFVDTRYG